MNLLRPIVRNRPCRRRTGGWTPPRELQLLRRWSRTLTLSRIKPMTPRCRTPYPRSAGFDTDIGAFIESSSVSSPLGPMAPLIINNDTVQGETFLPRQIFVFGGFALRANSLGHLEQIESYAPGHQVRFGSLNYTADICGDLIFDGFEPQPSVPHCHGKHDLALQPDSTLEAALEPAPIFNSEPVVQIEDGWLDTASGAATSTARAEQ